MKIDVSWNERMKFTATDGENRLAMDGKPPFGDGSAFTPKQLVLAGMAGCTGIDVVALLKKHKQPLEKLTMSVDAPQTEGHPAKFSKAELLFRFEGELDPKVVLEAVTLSQTRYCGVSAMLADSFPITYKVFLNDEEIGEGRANFS
jgi:putative redox protein